jgi:hypothetical protein
VASPVHRGLCPVPAGIHHFEFNNIDSLKAAISDKTCAVVIEPVQGEGGVLPADKAFLQAARELCDQHNALLIFDEVQTGVGRTGSLYAYQEYGVTPDILSSAKSLGGGFPIGAMLTTDKIAQSFSVGTHGTTYGGNPLAASVALKVIEIVNTPEVLAGVRAKSQRLRDGLNAINAKYQVFKEVRGMGLLLGCVLTDAFAGRAKDFVTPPASISCCCWLPVSMLCAWHRRWWWKTATSMKPCSVLMLPWPKSSPPSKPVFPARDTTARLCRGCGYGCACKTAQRLTPRGRFPCLSCALSALPTCRPSKEWPLPAASV